MQLGGICQHFDTSKSPAVVQTPPIIISQLNTIYWRFSHNAHTHTLNNSLTIALRRLPLPGPRVAATTQTRRRASTERTRLRTTTTTTLLPPPAVAAHGAVHHALVCCACRAFDWARPAAVSVAVAVANLRSSRSQTSAKRQRRQRQQPQQRVWESRGRAVRSVRVCARAAHVRRRRTATRRTTG